MVPALVDVNNPGLTGPVQNQPDFQAGSVDHRTHFVSAVPSLVRRAMAEYSALTGRTYAPLLTYGCEDADYIMVGLGSITDDVQAVLPVLRAQGLKAGVISVKLLQPFPEAELIQALAGAKAVTVLERSDQTALTSLVTSALFKARANADGVQYEGIPPLESVPRLTTAIFGLGGHDVQPRHVIAAYKHMAVRHRSAADLPGVAVLLQGPWPEHGGDPGPAACGVPGDGAHGAGDRGEPGAPASDRAPYPVPLRRRLRNDRHGQAAHRHSRRRTRHALQVGTEVRLGEERRPDQLLHHPQPRAGPAHQRRVGGRRDRGLAGPQVIHPRQPAQGPGRGRHVHPPVRPARPKRSGASCRSTPAAPSAPSGSTSSSSTPSAWRRSTPRVPSSSSG